MYLNAFNNLIELESSTRSKLSNKKSLLLMMIVVDFRKERRFKQKRLGGFK